MASDQLQQTSILNNILRFVSHPSADMSREHINNTEELLEWLASGHSPMAKNKPSTQTTACDDNADLAKPYLAAIDVA